MASHNPNPNVNKLVSDKEE